MKRKIIKDELTELLEKIDFEPKFALGIAKMGYCNSFEESFKEIINRYGNFEVVKSIEDEIRRYIHAEPFRDLITMNAIISTSKKHEYNNLLINVGLSKDLCLSELGEYAKKTNFSIAIINEDNIRSELNLELICRDEMLNALRFYIGFRAHGPLFMHVYNKFIEYPWALK